LNAIDMELNPINIENIEMKDDVQQPQPLIITDIEDVVIRKPLDKTR